MNNQERLMKILLAPHISEKANRVAERYNQVVFKVLCDATKLEIKDAVELMFNVKVQGVTVANVKGKRKRFGAVYGRRSDWKKAYVSLESGQEIDFLVAE
ncbi:MAG: 50S ribosomal protein L23 [Candidatus Competibacteraceae bacterium]